MIVSPSIESGPYGHFSSDLGWVPAPRYILRRHEVLRIMRGRPAGRLLEIGCGAGALLQDMAALGHDCVATEHSDEAYEKALQFSTDHPGISIHREIDANWSESFDYVLAFEVLEHIENDLQALRQWKSLLKPGGWLLLSVPAHQRKWSATDVGAGHFRRYERKGLSDVLEQAGFEIHELEMYGFPLANMIAPIQSLRYRRKLKSQQLSDAEDSDSKLANTSHSGVDRSIECKAYPFYSNPLGRSAMRFFCEVQALFRNSEWGNGYLALARRDS